MHDHDDFIHVLNEELNQCIISYYYHKCQSYSSAQRAVMRLFFNWNRSLERFFFWALDWEFSLEFGKREDILDWEWGLYSAPGDREKRPWHCPKCVLWHSHKQWRPRWNALKCSVSSGSTLFAQTKTIFRERNAILFWNNNLWPIDVYNGPSQVCFFNPEGRIP